ncbi:hydroxymethylglutaryl-CoA synthase family protein [Streptomyces sp. NPDC058374]|uniref:hydroxymethylglutaryl-CoA synthase family protein n=1 Tax=unclassified Streptomyces TaxID=2593676 RepID=UPI00365A2AC8
MTRTSDSTTPPRYGIEALNVYAGLARIPVTELVAGRGMDLARVGNIMMRERSVGLPFEDPVTNAVNAARPLVDALSPPERERIELLVTSTESGIDYSKSVSSYVHEYLGLSRNCRLVEVKQACYAATAAVQLAIGYAASGVSPGGKALVIATDVALVDERAGLAEPATGHGAAAVLIGDAPRVLAADLGAFGNYSYETMDSARPTPEFDIADVDRSLFAYLDCLTNSFEDYRSRVEDADFVTTFDQLAMHTPFAGLVKAGHRKMMRASGDVAPEVVEEDFARRVAPSLVYPALVGNLCSGSVYLALASLVDHAALERPSRVGLYSYGSGCSSEFFSGVVDPGSRAALAPMRIAEQLDRRAPIAFGEYTELLTETLRCLVPEKHRTVDVERYASHLPAERLLVHTATKDFHRQYAWT